MNLSPKVLLAAAALTAGVLTTTACDTSYCRTQWDGMSPSEQQAYPYDGDYQIFKTGCELANADNAR